MVEGPKLLAEAVDAGATIEAVYLDGRDASADHRELASRTGAAVLELRPGVLGRACDAVTPQPVAAVVAMPDVPLTAIKGTEALLALICVELQDPGNAGALLRAAGAAGCGAVVFTAASVDPYNPKAVRSSAGALFHVPVVTGIDAEEVLDELGRWGVRRLGTAARGGGDYLDEDLTRATALVLGNESRGLPAMLDARLDGHVTVPMAAAAESLNVVTAAAVICFEANRQRRRASR